MYVCFFLFVCLLVYLFFSLNVSAPKELKSRMCTFYCNESVYKERYGESLELGEGDKVQLFFLFCI